MPQRIAFNSLLKTEQLIYLSPLQYMLTKDESHISHLFVISDNT